MDSEGPRSTQTGVSRLLLVHEWISGRTGSEKVFEALAEQFPDADLLALTATPHHGLRIPPGRLRTTWLDHAALRERRNLTLPLMPLVWWTARTGQHDAVITSHHAAAHHVGRGLEVPHLVYVHSPARYVWSPELDGRGARSLFRPVQYGLKALDRRAARSVTSYAANSSAVAERVKRFWRREAVVIHPPVDVDYFSTYADERDARQGRPRRSPPEGYVLGVSRFIPYKKLDRVIEVGEILQRPVVIAGAGPLEAELRHRAACSSVPVEIVMSPKDNELRRLYRDAACLVFPAIEDFGIVMVEAQAAGTPVVAPGNGGALDIVIDGFNGALAPSNDAHDLAEAAELVLHLDRAQITASAQRFDPATFHARIAAWLRQHS